MDYQTLFRHINARKERAVMIGTDQWITSGPAARTAALRGRIHGCTRTFRESVRFFSLAPRAPSIHGTSPHVAGVMLQHLTGAQVELVHYRGGAPALQDLMAGQVDVIMNQASVFLPYRNDERIRIYAVLAKRRLPQAPNVPTVDEGGLPGLYLSSWNAIWAPKGTPHDNISRLNTAVVDALHDSTVSKRFIELGQVIPPAGQLTPEALGAYQRAEIEKWWP